MIYLSTVLKNCLKNCFKIGNMSIDLSKTKTGLILRYRVDRGVFWGAHELCCSVQVRICNCANSLISTKPLALVKASQVTVFGE